MTTTFQINEAELNIQFLKSLKTMFKNCNLTLTIEADEYDETDYLMKSNANHTRLMNAIKNVEADTNLIEVDMNELRKLANA